MVELVYTPDLKSCGQHDLAGSIPAPSTRSPFGDLFFLISLAYIVSFIYFCINTNSNSNMETSTIVIKHYYTGKVLFAHTCEGNTQRITVERAVSQDVSLRYADLSGFDLEDANLFGADLYNAFLREANLWGADLRDTDCYHTTFEGAVCDSAFFNNSLLWAADFTRASCQRTSFVGCAADNSTFVDADLRDADFSDTSLRGADMRGALTLGASFADSWVKDVFWGMSPTSHVDSDTTSGCESAREEDSLICPQSTTMPILPPYGALLPVDDFLALCEEGYFTDDGGVGFYVSGQRKSSIVVRPSDVLLGELRSEFTHVLWLNK